MHRENKCKTCAHARRCVYAARADAVLACVLYTSKADKYRDRPAVAVSK